MAIFTPTITAAQVLAALTTDTTKWAGASIDGKISQFNPLFYYDVLNDSVEAIAGTWDTATHASDWLGKYLRNFTTHAINDRVGIGNFFVPVAGTYTAYLIATTDSTHGMAHFIINGTDCAQIDCYSAVAAHNAVLSASLGTLTVGQKNLSISVDSKHASSTDYNMAFQAIIIVKT